jgi:hypothetical protein
MSQKTEVIITAKDETRAAIASAQRGLQSLSTSAAGMRASFSAIAGAGGLLGFLGGASAIATIKGAVDELDALNLSAERLGVSASKLDTLNFAGKLAGLDDGDIEKALTKISVKLEEAEAGSKSAIAWFEKLGVAWRDSAKNVKTADQAFNDIADKISGMADGTGKVTTLVEGFGEKLGRKLAPALNDGASGLKALREEAEKLAGGAYSLDELAKQADTFNDNIDKLGFASKAAGRSLANEFLPSLVDTTQAMIDLQKEGNLALSVLRGFAGLGKLPFDFALSGLTKDLKDLSVGGQVKDLEAKLGGLQAKLIRSKQPGGLLGQFIYGKPEDVEREIAITTNQIAGLKKFADKLEFKPTQAPVVKKTKGGSSDEPDKPKKAKKEVDDAERVLASLREKISLDNVDLQSTDKLTAAEKERAKVKYQLEKGTLKATAAQSDEILAAADELVGLEKRLAAQEEYRKALESQESTNVKNNQAMIEQIASVEKANELYGLSASQITAVAVAHLEDATALAAANGAYPEHIAFLEEETKKLRELGAVQEDGDLKALLANTKSAQEAARAAKVSTLDRALAAGKIDPQQYKEAIDGLKEQVNALDEFTKEAARNMQDAMADFFINPTKDGMSSIAESFGQTVQKMIAQAASAQLMNLLFGDLGKTGKLSGVVGDIPWAKIFSVFEFADGGIMTSAGNVPLRKYAGGGIANSPQMAMFGEGSTPEAYVPLPDGRRIPVAMSGGGQPVNQVMNFYGSAEPAQVKRAAAAGARSVLGVANGARRYG